ncbi:hypothetical protein EI71_01403 [Anaeroplasma bactoclasticum]|jgi:hypothetical protein|uniref:Uncharacterized protein n=1 Tax=Anaeroplasma bactoclasticum TaxID=2088 RepID=A0A397RSV9_9MOLU|nr:hypothetical protein [Anaeroplasma bactoclasticum]RIA75509.1 hypothetical protein EI71_01403 [Anaeroplasma bactoclasticum]
MENNRIDEINDIMTLFLNNLTEVAKEHTLFKEQLGIDHEYTKFAKGMVRLFNQYQRLYVYMKDEEEYAKELVKVSEYALEVLSYKPYEMLEGGFFKKKFLLKSMKPLREEAMKKLNSEIDKINGMINQCVKTEELEEVK